MRIRMLDLFCGAGGAAVGYHRALTAAGFDVDIIGVDIKPQQRYPFAFRQADAMTWPLIGYDFIHASPPCQRFTRAQPIQNRKHPDLLGPIRRRLQRCESVWVIENVIGAPMGHFVQLCGTNFGLKVYRHRQFESNILLLSPGKCHHPSYLLDGYVCVYGDQVRGRQKGNTGNQYPHYSTSYGREAMGIDWMNRAELSQAIPPAYTEWIGKQLASVFVQAVA